MTTELKIVDQSKLTAAESAGKQMSAPLVRQADELTVTNNDAYLEADILLARVKRAKTQVEELINPIIEPIRKGLDKLYEFRRGLLGPVEKAEETVKGKMSEWQKVERLRIAEENRRKHAEEQRLQQEADRKRREAERLENERRAKEKEAERAKSAAAQAKAKREAEELRQAQEKADREAYRAEERAVTAQAQPDEKVVKGAFSRTTEKKTWKVTDLQALAAGVGNGEVPGDVLEVVGKVMNRYWKETPELVLMWPGVEAEEVTSVGGR